MAGVLIANLNQLRLHTTDKKKYTAELQAYSEKYPSLRENNNFTAILAQSILELFSEAYEKRNITEGENYKLQFETLVTKNPSVTTMLQYEIGYAYSAACVHYFKIGQKSKAKTFVEKGLTYAPNNYELKMRKEMLSR
jgi:hypothetical protein